MIDSHGGLQWTIKWLIKSILLLPADDTSLLIETDSFLS